MARQEALLRLHKLLITRRSDLRRKLAGELADMRTFKASDSTGDSADVAFESGSDEMSSQLAEFDARELGQIERALARLKQGSYGLCESCVERIPVARLNALPYTTLCIGCQREMERYPGWSDHYVSDNWEKVADAASLLEEPRDLDLADIEMDLTSHR